MKISVNARDRCKEHHVMNTDTQTNFQDISCMLVESLFRTLSLENIQFGESFAASCKSSDLIRLNTFKAFKQVFVRWHFKSIPIFFPTPFFSWKGDNVEGQSLAYALTVLIHTHWDDGWQLQTPLNCGTTIAWSPSACLDLSHQIYEHDIKTCPRQPCHNPSSI